MFISFKNRYIGLCALMISLLSVSFSGVSGSKFNELAEDKSQLNTIIDPKLRPVKRIIAIGDSLTAGAYGAEYRTMLSKLSGLAVVNLGVGAQNSKNIAARMGVRDVYITLHERVLKDGSYLVKDIENSPLTSQGTQHIKCAQIKVMDCELIRNPKTNELFLSIKNVVKELPASFSLRMAHPNINKNDFAVVWVGRNNFFEPNVVISDIESIRIWLKDSGVDYVVLSVLTAGNDIIGTMSYKYVQTINSHLSSRYPVNYLDIRRILIANYKSEAKSDLADYSDDTVPSSLREDAVHLTQSGHNIVAEELFKWISSLK
jgi:lysophospholipase L1-like esterase